MKAATAIRSAFILGVLMSAAATLQAQSWTVASVTVNAGYDFTTVTTNVDIRVVSPNPRMDFFMTIDGGGTSELYPRRCYLGGNGIDYNIYQDTTYQDIILPVTEPLTVDNVFWGRTANGNGRYDVTVPIQAPAAQSGTVFPSGNYTSTLTVRVYAGTFAAWVAGLGTDPPVVTGTMTVTFTVANNYVRVLVAADGGTWDEGTTNATLDFGTLSTGLTRSLDVLVKSYPRNWYTLQFQSAHGGALAPTIAGPPNIPYTFYYEGVARSLAAAYTSPQYPDMEPADNDPDVYDIDFVIGTVDPVNQLPGEYSDIITITLTAIW